MPTRREHDGRREAGADCASRVRARCTRRLVALLLAWSCLAGTAIPGHAAASRPASRVVRDVIDVWDTEDGLPRNSVTAIVQGQDGFLWLGTLNGLVRFDGVRFTVFDESNTPELKHSLIVSLFQDRQGTLWIGSELGGVARMKDGVITSLEIGGGSADRRLIAACEDAEGAVWLYTADGQLWQYLNERFSVFVFGMEQTNARRSIITDRAGTVWAGTDRRLASIQAGAGAGHFEPRIGEEIPVGTLDRLLASASGGYWRLADGRIRKYQGTVVDRDLGPYPWGQVTVAAACEDRQGDLLVGTLGAGVFRLDARGKVSRLSTSEGLASNYILSLFVDRDGSLWVGTDGGGLNRVKRPVFEVFDVARDLGIGVVQSVSADAQGGLWVGSNGGGLACYRGEQVTRFGSDEGLTHPAVWSVLVDREQNVWAGTWGFGLFQLRDGRFQRVPGAEAIPRVVFALHEDRSGKLWLGTPSGLVARERGDWRVFTTRDGLSADEVRAIADDGEGGLWVGTRGGGLNRLQEGRFTVVHKPEGLPGEDISALYRDADGVLWVGTFANGLGRFEAGRWTRYTVKDGLVSNAIGWLLEDHAGYLWIGSNAGLMRVARQDLNAFARETVSFVAVRTYGKPDGLPTRECTMGSQPGGWRAADGKLWFPTVKGLVGVHPAQLRPNTNPPPVLIEAVLIDGQSQGTNAPRADPVRAVVVPAGKEHLDIHYTSINLVAPDKGRFRYRMEGHETKLTEAGTSRVAHYSRLPPGQYRFHVTACNEDGVWNDVGASLAVTVETPLWKTAWFLTTLSLGLLAAVAGAVHYLSTQRLKRQLERLRQEEALERERARIARDIHDQLGASLTQVALLGELVEGDKADPVEVEAHARQISQTARDTTRVLDEIVWAVNPSNDTLDGLMTYVSKYAQEYLSLASVRCRLDVPAELPAHVLPPEVRHNLFLAFKEAITNVIRHARASAVWVRLRLQPDAFVLEVEDNGRGMPDAGPQAASTRNGLRNMRQRLADTGGRCEFSPATEGGTVVRLIVPLRPR